MNCNNHDNTFTFCFPFTCNWFCFCLLLFYVKPVSLAHLFFGTVATDHPGGQFHGVVLVLIVANITGVSPTTAGKPDGRKKKFFMISYKLPCQTHEVRQDTLTTIPKPTMALFVMLACSFFWQWFPLLHSGIFYRLIMNGIGTWTCTNGEKKLTSYWLACFVWGQQTFCINAHIYKGFDSLYTFLGSNSNVNIGQRVNYGSMFLHNLKPLLIPLTANEDERWPVLLVRGWIYWNLVLSARILSLLWQCSQLNSFVWP